MTTGICCRCSNIPPIGDALVFRWLVNQSYNNFHLIKSQKAKLTHEINNILVPWFLSSSL
jgi:hypothetical protein